MAVVFGTELDQLDGCLEIVEETVYVCKQNLDVAAGTEELGDLEDRYELQCVSQYTATVGRSIKLTYPQCGLPVVAVPQ